MALNKVTYVDGRTIITAKNLNDIQDEIIDQGDALNTGFQELHDNYRTAADQNVIDSEQDECIEDLEQTTTATTIGPSAIATFEASAANMPLKGLTVNIEPVQAEGTPSPENPLPITGWTGVNVFDDPEYALKINWNQIRTDSAQTNTADGITTTYDPQTHLCTITNNSRTTNFSSGSTQCVVSNVNPIPGHKYALLGEYHAGVAVVAVNGTALRTIASVGQILTMYATTPNTGFRLRITSSYDFVSAHPVGDVYSFYLNIVDITQLLGEEAAATAIYDQIAEMFPNDWYPYNAGEITCVSAVNGDPHRKISVNWQNEAGTVYGGTFDVVNRKLNSYPYYSSYNGETIIGPWISSMDVYAPGATPTLGAQVVDMGGAATSYDLSDVPEITTFLGTNNIWADTGDITVTYGAYLETVKSYADQAEAVLESIQADYTELSEDVDDLKSARDMFKAKNVLQTSLLRGEYIKGSNPNGGTPVSSNAFCRTTSLLSGYGEKISIEITDPRYEFYVSYYGANGALDGTDYLGYSGYQSAFVIPENAVKIGISFRRVDHANLAADELTNISNAIYYTGITDVSLSLVGKAADAKATGQAISNAGFYWSDDSNSLIRTFSDVIAKYDELCARYPDYIRKNALTSGDFTNYEYILTIGNYNSQNGHRGQDPEIAKPVILITAGVHGDERAAIAGLYGFVKATCENVTSLNKIIYAATYKIIPVVCPSGFNDDSRINSNGVNINRNFNTTDWTLLPTGRNYSGAAPADQPETKVVQAWITENNNALLYIDWHNSAYTNEISCFLGLSTNNTNKWKKKYLTAINNIIPWWATGRNIPASNIYGYTGSPRPEYSNTGTAVTYARESGIETSFVLETSWNVIESGKASKFSIGVGQEAFTNMMIGFSDLINDSII